jgi:hypothetical protein
MKIAFTPAAHTLITDWNDAVLTVGHVHGFTSPEYLKSLESLKMALLSIVRLGGRVMKDSDNDLIAVNEYITYGVNFDPRTTTWSVNS